MAKDFSNLTDPPYPRGIVNNNPGNIRSGILWLGARNIPGAFCVFTNCAYGLRAMAKDLTTKITKDGLNTISLIINKYAPPSENDTQAYINKVAAYTGWGQDDPISLTPDNLLLLMKAQISVEQGPQYLGGDWLTDDDINEGIGMITNTIFNYSLASVFPIVHK